MKDRFQPKSFEKEYPDPRIEAELREVQAKIAVWEIVFGDQNIVWNQVFYNILKTRSRQKWFAQRNPTASKP